MSAKESTLTAVLKLEGHKLISSISYFPDGKRMISRSGDKTTRRWDLRAGKEIDEARGFYEPEVLAVGVSKDARWVVTGGGDWNNAELNACEVYSEVPTRWT